jgi:peroxisome-assembly ATPase
MLVVSAWEIENKTYALILCNSASRSLSTLHYNAKVSKLMSPGAELLRSMYSTIAADSVEGTIFFTL